MKKLFILFLTLIMCLSMSVQVSATSSPHFADVPKTFWAYEFIERAYADGVVAGISGDATNYTGVFSPDTALTNAQFCTILSQGFFKTALDTEFANGNIYPWYAPYMAVNKAYGILDGTAIEANPNAVATRYDMSVAMVAVLKSAGVKMPTTEELLTVQHKIGDWDIIPDIYQNSVSTVYALGLITGVNKQGDFSGNEGVSRAAMCTVYCHLADSIAALSGGSEHTASEYYPRTGILTYSSITSAVLAKYDINESTYIYTDVGEVGSSFLKYTEYLDSVEAKLRNRTNYGGLFYCIYEKDGYNIEILYDAESNVTAIALYRI